MTHSQAKPAGIVHAPERIALVADAGSFEPWDEDVVATDPLGFHDIRPYRERLRAALDVGRTEAVLTGRATLDGRPLAVIAAEFGFLGGSIGVATGERITRAIERAGEQDLPVLAMTASGGSRMQEGTLSLVQMVKISAAVRRFRDAGGCYLVYLMHPTTGGVLASWGSLGTLTFAMPGALIGFGGPRVVKLLTGRSLPADVQRAERMAQRGLVDAVVAPEALREHVARALAVAAHHDPAPQPAAAPADTPPPADGDAWASLQRARDHARPSAGDLLASGATDVTELRGDGQGGGDDPACLAAFARLRGLALVFVGQRRDPEHGGARMTPAGYRKARRAMALADELRLPLLAVIDTPGAEMSAAAEEGGLAAEIARCLSDMSALRIPTLSVLMGEGGSGGALALLPADRVICAEHASLEVIAPEGASAILHRSPDRAPELAATQGGASWELARRGIADVIVPEPTPADADRDGFLARLVAVIDDELRRLVAWEPGARLEARRARYRGIGGP